MSNQATEAKEAVKDSQVISVLKKLGNMNLKKVGIGGIGVAVAGAALLPFFGAIMIFGLGVGCLVVLGALFHAYMMLRKSGIVKPVDIIFDKTNKAQDNTPESAGTEAGPEYKLWDMHDSIHIFANEPSVTDIMRVRNVTQQEAEDLFVVENNTKVIIVNDPSRAAVKVRVVSGEAHGRVGWVCRSMLLKSEVAA